MKKLERRYMLNLMEKTLKNLLKKSKTLLKKRQKVKKSLMRQLLKRKRNT